MFVNKRAYDIITSAVNRYATDIPPELVSLRTVFQSIGGQTHCTYTLWFKRSFELEVSDIVVYADAINELAQLANILNVCHITEILYADSGYGDIDADEGYDFYTDAEAQQEAEHLLEVFYTGNTRAIRAAIKELSIEEPL